MAEEDSVEQRAAQWIQLGDVGLSSKSIYLHMRGAKLNQDIFSYYGSSDKHWPFPRDADDFGRCVKLLQLIPEWSVRLGEMKECGKVWELLIANWADITALYKAESVKPYSEFCPKTSELINQLIEKNN